jgi:hypothetical protein
LHLKIDIRIRTKNGLKITHIGLKIEAIRLKIDARESLYIESQLKIRPLLLKIEPEIGLKIAGGEEADSPKNRFSHLVRLRTSRLLDMLDIHRLGNIESMPHKNAKDRQGDI